MVATMKMRNADKMRIFHCFPEELDELKLAFKDQMQRNLVNGKPFFGQLPDEVDQHGEIRSYMWQSVASSRDNFAEMLSGSRWGDNKPQDFDAQLREAKAKILRDHMTTQRKTWKRGLADHQEAGTRKRRASSEDVDDESETPSHRPSKRVQKRPVGRPFPLRLEPANGANDAVDDHASQHNEVAESIGKTTATSAGTGTGKSTISVQDKNGGPSDPISIPETPMSSVSSQTAQKIPQQPVPARFTLSERIQQIVARSVSDMSARVTNIEEVMPLDVDLNNRESAVERRLMERVEALNDEVQDLRAELEAERLWRTM